MGLLAVWREGLLAQKVLQGRTRGYTRHPQLERFRKTSDPLAAIGAFLFSVAEEAGRRGYRFDVSKIEKKTSLRQIIPVTLGQVRYEWKLLSQKLKARAPETLNTNAAQQETLPEVNTVFLPVPGDIEEWERIKTL